MTIIVALLETLNYCPFSESFERCHQNVQSLFVNHAQERRNRQKPGVSVVKNFFVDIVSPTLHDVQEKE